MLDHIKRIILGVSYSFNNDIREDLIQDMWIYYFTVLKDKIKNNKDKIFSNSNYMFIAFKNYANGRVKYYYKFNEKIIYCVDIEIQIFNNENNVSMIIEEMIKLLDEKEVIDFKCLYICQYLEKDVAKMLNCSQQNIAYIKNRIRKKLVDFK